MGRDWLRRRSQTGHRTRLALGLAPSGWSVVAYKEDRILTLAASGEAGDNELTVALVHRLSRNLHEYGVREVEAVTINEGPAQLGRQATESSDGTWILEAQTSSGPSFSLQAPAGLSRDQVIQIGVGVPYAP